MKFSIFKESVTPDWPIRLEGFRERILPNEGIYDDIYTMALLLDDGKKKVLLITIDVCLLDSFFPSEIKKRINAKYGLDEDNIIVHAIHTHAAPVTFLSNSQKGTPDSDSILRFLKLLEQKIMLCAGNCMSHLKEGYIEIGTGKTYIGMSRRQKKPEGIKIGPNPEEEIDRQIYALTIKNSNGKAEAIVFSCPCHPVVLYYDNMYISADFPGAARAEIEKKYPGAAAMFLQGAGADINPAVLVADDKYRKTHYSDVLFIGRVLANDIDNILQKGMKRLDVSIDLCWDKILLPLKDHPAKENKPDIRQDVVQGEIQAAIVKLSDDFRIVMLDGEICNQLGMYIKELFTSGDTMVLGYVNGCIGYLPTAKIVREGGYESVRTRFAAPFAESVEKVLLSRLKDLISPI